MIENLIGLFGVAFLYLIAGLVSATAFGGRDPLSFAPWPVIVLWPVYWLVALLFALSSISPTDRRLVRMDADKTQHCECGCETYHIKLQFDDGETLACQFDADGPFEDINELRSSLETVEERTGKIERILEALQG